MLRDHSPRKDFREPLVGLGLNVRRPVGGSTPLEAEPAGMLGTIPAYVIWCPPAPDARFYRFLPFLLPTLPPLI